MSNEELNYKTELVVMRELAKDRDLSDAGKVAYINQLKRVQDAYWAMYRASVAADAAAKEQKNAGKRK